MEVVGNVVHLTVFTYTLEKGWEVTQQEASPCGMGKAAAFTLKFMQ